MCNRVLEKQGFEKPVAEMLTSVTDDGSRSIKSTEDVGLDEFHYNLVIISLGGHDFYPFGDIVYLYQNVLITKIWWKRGP